MDSRSKAKAHEIGADAERLGQLYLRSQGYKVLHSNFLCSGGEIDCIAMEGSVLCFVEIRARSSAEHGHPLETIGRQKQRRIVRAARAFMDEWVGPWPNLRFDALGILLGQTPDFTLVKEAFEA